MSKKRLPPSPTPAAIVVALADAGVPLAPDELAERLALVGGGVSIWSTAGRGSEVFAFVPLPEAGRSPAAQRRAA